MEKSVIAVFDEQSDAQEALSELSREGFPSSQARISSMDDSGLAGEGEDLQRSERRQSAEGGIGEAIARFFGMGDDHHTYNEAVRRGGYVVTVDVSDDADADRVQAILYRHNPVDIDERTEQWRQSGWELPMRAQPEDRFTPPLPENDMALTGGAGIASEPYAPLAGAPDSLTARTSAPGSSRQTEVSEADLDREGHGRVIPVVEEELAVGKREVQRGGVRIVTRTSETPVEANVSLREEHATVTRRPVDRPVTDADTAFVDQTIEVRETAEEAVISKTARIVEEIEVGKETTQREQTVRDTVRKTEVEVEPLEAAGAVPDGTLSSVKLYEGPERRKSTSAAYGGIERRAASS